MRQNLANRLGATGFWAIKTAWASVEISRMLRAEGQHIPVGATGSDVEVFTICGVEMMQHLCNMEMDGMRMNVSVEPIYTPQGRQAPRMFDKAGQPISLQQWSIYAEDEHYKRVGLWYSDTHRTHVSTVWTGVDPGTCPQPQIFETMIVGIDQHEQPHIRRIIRTPTLGTAQEVHRQVIELVKAGRM